MAEVKVGEVVKFFAKPSVAAVIVTEGTLKLGDTVHFKGHTTDFTQQIESMQYLSNTVERTQTSLNAS